MTLEIRKATGALLSTVAALTDKVENALTVINADNIIAVILFVFFIVISPISYFLKYESAMLLHQKQKVCRLCSYQRSQTTACLFRQ